LGQLEALVALSAYAYEHPEDPFPALTSAGSRYVGAQLGHPLLPRERCVRNDVDLGAPSRLLVVSGSNMSGKSTLLRTVGINAVLAQAGAPVCAASLQLSPLVVGASIAVHDSLQDGASRFYAEVKRLRAIAQAAREGRPVLFLVDEILHGTNPADRRIGAQAVVDGFLEHGAVGLITTHDLALTELTERLGGAARNVHFEDQLEAGRMVFDYRLRDGVVRKSNALALMRAVGLIE
jgi:DNA mismatch repair ATPase MutS